MFAAISVISTVISVISHRVYEISEVADPSAWKAAWLRETKDTTSGYKQHI